jgi:hypothetical protein
MNKGSQAWNLNSGHYWLAEAFWVHLGTLWLANIHDQVTL